jgi:hypothetical protein
MKKKLIIGIFIIAVLVAGVLVFGYYPVLIVNGAPIFARQVWTDRAAALSSYQKVVDTYASGTAVAAPSAASIDSAILSTLVDRMLIGAGLRQYFDARTLEELIAQKIAPFDSAAQAGKAIYGLDEPAFRNEVLIPQAERDILSSKLFLEGIQFNSWFSEAEASAKVSVFYPGLHWDGKAIVKN